MEFDIKVDSAGRIVLPASVRRLLNLGPGSRLALDIVAQKIELTPLAPLAPDPDGPRSSQAGRLVLSATGQRPMPPQQRAPSAPLRQAEAALAGDAVARHVGAAGVA